MRNLKKFLALVLAMVMAFSLMLTVNATTTGTQYNDASGVTPAFEEAVDVLTGMKVFQGDAEAPTFRPASSITRAEVAAVIYRLVTGDVTDTQANLYTTRHPFTDVASNAWYAGYVGYLYNAKIIKGVTATTFNPRESVTGYEVLAMILRAVGYDKNGEFTGNTWRVEVASTSKTLGILKDVDTTIYGGTLHLAARRDVVASLLFNTAAYVPMVQYTLAFGYQDTGMEGGVVGATKNPTLGYKIFGLTSNTGVVVGNEVTGEAKGTTKIGFSLKTLPTGNSLGITWNWTDPGDHTQGGTWDNDIRPTGYTTEIDDTLARGTWSGSSAYVYANDDHPLPGNVTRSFNFSTDLRLFNHAVKVWYDARSSQYVTVGSDIAGLGTTRFTTNLTTYAYFDKATNTSVVSVSTDDNVTLGTLADKGNLANAATNPAAGVSNNWTAPGFTLRHNGTNYQAYSNYSFGPMVVASYASDVPDSPVLKNNNNAGGAGDEEWGLYLLISNSADKALDVVIPLDMTFTKITQINNTTRPLTVGVYNGNISPVAGGASANKYFDTWDTVQSNNNEEYAVIAQDNLRNSPNTALNTKVAAIQITGTAPGILTRNPILALGAPGDVDAGNAIPVDVPHTGNTADDATDNSSYYYQLTENKLLQTYKVLYINPNNQDLTIQKADGTTTVLHQSVFAEAVDATFTTNMEGVAVAAAGTYTKQLEEGRDYTFTLDEAGNYIYWTTPADTAKFVYGTYMDFTSKLASSSFDYPMVYVGQNGEAKQQENITEATVWDGTQLAQMTMGTLAYTNIELPKRDSDAAAAATSGFQRGFYIGYALNGTKLTAVTSSNSQDTGFLQATVANFGAAALTIDKTAETLGAVSVASGDPNIEYFLTNNTTFYVVDGAGTDNQTVTEYKGLTGLRAGYKDVKIDVTTTTSKLLTQGKYLLAADGSDGPQTYPYSMVYYSFGRQDYAQDYMGSAYEIRTVFLPKDALTFTGNVENSLRFVGSKRLNNISVVNGDQITQFTMYDAEGNEGKYWVDGYIADGGDHSSAWVIDQNGNNVFYNLIQTGKATVDGQPIYSVRPLTGDEPKAVIGAYYNGTVTVTGSTVTYTAGTDNSQDPAATDDAPAVYAATTVDSQLAYIDTVANVVTATPPTANLYNVGSAKIVNLNKGTYPGIDGTLASLNNAGSLTDNTGVPVSCVRDGVVVSTIFVNA